MIIVSFKKNTIQKMKKSLLLLALSLFCTPFFLQAQEIIGTLNLEDETQKHFIISKSGNKLEGRILEMGTDSLIFFFEHNSMKMNLQDIVSIEVIEEEVEAPEKIKKINWAKRYPNLNIVGDLDLDNEKQFHTLTTNQGNTFSGRVVSISDDGVKFLVSGRSTITFRLARVKGIVVHGNVKPAEKRIVNRINDTIPPSLSNIMDKGVFIGDSTQTHVILTKRGDRFVGLVSEADDVNVVFKLNNRLPMTIAIRDIKKIAILGEEEKVEEALQYTIEDFKMVGHENLFVMPTGFNLEKGETEYRNIALFANTIETGITDNFSIGGGIIPLFVSNSFLVKTKASVSLGDYLHISGTLMGIWAFYLNSFDTNEEAFWSGIGSLSLGTKEQFLSISYGTWKPVDRDHNPFWSIGGSFRIQNKWRLFGNAIFVPGDETFFLPFGASWFNKNHKVDFGLLGAYDGYSPIVFPMGGYALRF